MAIVYRANLNRPLTFNESDGNFEHFTGSYSAVAHVPGVLTFDMITITTNDPTKVFYSSSGDFYNGNTYFGHY